MLFFRRLFFLLSVPCLWLVCIGDASCGEGEEAPDLNPVGDWEDLEQRVPDPRMKGRFVGVDIMPGVLALNKEGGFAASNGRPMPIFPAGQSPVMSKIENGAVIRLGGVVPTPAIYRGKLFTNNSRAVYCYDAVNGQYLWGRRLSDPGPSTPVVSQGVVLVNTESCTLYALDASSGQLLWSRWLSSFVLSTPTISGSHVFTSYQQGRGVLICFSLKTGQLVWRRHIDSEALFSPVVDGDMLYVATRNGGLYRVEKTTGNIVSAWRCGICSPPVIRDGKIYITRRADLLPKSVQPKESIVKCDAKTGLVDFELDAMPAPHVMGAGMARYAREIKGVNYHENKHSAKAAMLGVIPRGVPRGVFWTQSFQGSRVLLYGKLGYSCAGDKLTCFYADTGKTKWVYRPVPKRLVPDRLLPSPPIIAGGELVLPVGDGTLQRLDAQTGIIKKIYDIEHPLHYQPAVVNGRIYLGTADGLLVCMNTDEPHLTGWPMWGGSATRSGVYATSLAKKIEETEDQKEFRELYKKLDELSKLENKK